MSLRAHLTPLDLGALPKSLLFLRAYMQWI